MAQTTRTKSTYRLSPAGVAPVRSPLLQLFNQMDKATALDLLIEEHYHKLSAKERRDLYEQVVRLPFFSLKNESCQLFSARYNPKNQFRVRVDFNGAGETYECFKFGDMFHTGKQLVINKNYIREVVCLENAA
jgi:hypothetical protein